MKSKVEYKRRIKFAEIYLYFLKNLEILEQNEKSLRKKFKKEIEENSEEVPEYFFKFLNKPYPILTKFEKIRKKLNEDIPFIKYEGEF